MLEVWYVFLPFLPPPPSYILTSLVFRRVLVCIRRCLLFSYKFHSNFPAECVLYMWEGVIYVYSISLFLPPLPRARAGARPCVCQCEMCDNHPLTDATAHRLWMILQPPASCVCLQVSFSQQSSLISHALTVLTKTRTFTFTFSNDWGLENVGFQGHYNSIYGIARKKKHSNCWFFFLLNIWLQIYCFLLHL